VCVLSTPKGLKNAKTLQDTKGIGTTDTLQRMREFPQATCPAGILRFEEAYRQSGRSGRFAHPAQSVRSETVLSLCLFFSDRAA
jgi:hypothetical protein